MRLDQQTLKADVQAIRGYLQSLSQGPRDGAHERRTESRYETRGIEVIVEHAEAGGDWHVLAGVTRNLSPSGIALLMGRFAYPGSAIRVHLRTLNGVRKLLRGTIAHCRYLTGSSNLHEVGVRLDEPIAPELFSRRATTLRVITAACDPETFAALGAALAEYTVEFKRLANPISLPDMIARQEYELVVIGETDDPGTVDMLSSLRKSGFAAPIVCTRRYGSEFSPTLIDAGCSAQLIRPVDAQALDAALSQLLADPVQSRFSDDNDMREPIDTFIQDAPNLARELETAYATSQKQTLNRLAATLCDRAEQLGFPEISGAAVAMRATLLAGASRAALRKDTNEVTRWLRAARPSNLLRKK